MEVMRVWVKTKRVGTIPRPFFCIYFKTPKNYICAGEEVSHPHAVQLFLCVATS
jgi:hypothetical protein